MARIQPVRLVTNALAAATCTRVPAGRAHRAESAGDAPTAYYEAGGAVPEAMSVEQLPDVAGVSRRRVLLPPRTPPGLTSIPLANDPIEILHVAPQHAEPRPLLMMSPILGNTTILVDRFATFLAQRGIHTALVQRKELAFHPEASVAQAEEEVRLVVMRSRQALDWLLTDERIDPHRLGTFGISAGAIVGSMLAGADPRLRAHLWMLAGGPLSDVMAHTVEAEYRDYRTEAMRVSGRRIADIRDTLRAELRTDPIRLAPHVDPDAVLMVLARFDRSVPYRYGLALWRALGRPERVLVPFGHYTTFLLLPWLERLAANHFSEAFGD